MEFGFIGVDDAIFYTWQKRDTEIELIWNQITLRDKIADSVPATGIVFTEHLPYTA